MAIVLFLTGLICIGLLFGLSYKTYQKIDAADQKMTSVIEPVKTKQKAMKEDIDLYTAKIEKKQAADKYLQQRSQTEQAVKNNTSEHERAPESESGDVSIKRADLTDGQISLDDGELQMGNSSFNGDMEITSSNGDVSIQMKKSSVDKTNIYLKTTDGDVDTGDLSRGKSSNEEDFSVYENQVGTSAPTLSVKCSDGDIMLTESAK